MLNFPREQHWHILQLEGEQDIEDILVLDDQGKVLVRVQVKQREDPHQWKPSDLREVLLAFAECPDSEETIYEFIYAGSEGKAFTNELKPIMQKIEFEGYEALTLSEVQVLRRIFEDEEVITFLRKIDGRLRLVNCGPWKDIKARDLGRISQLNLPKDLSRLTGDSAERTYSKLFEEIAQKTEPSSKYYRRMERKEILALLQGDDVLVEFLPEVGHYNPEDIKNYLDRFAERLAALPEYYPKDKFSFDQIRQRVKISRERLLYGQEQVVSRETARRSGFFEDDEEMRQKHLELAYQRRGAEMYELEEGPATREETLVDWEDTRHHFDRAIILGDPGFGKSWLLRYEGRCLAREQLLRFQEGPVDEEDICLPIHTRLGTLAETLEEKDPDLLKAILLVVQREYDIPDRFVLWMRRIIPTAQCVLLLDALDEVDEDKKQRLIDALGRLAENGECRIFLTSRIAGYRKAPFTLKNSKLDLELELVAFDWPQVASFVRNWFKEDDEQAQRLISILRREPLLRSQARIPLLLSFICLVAMSKVDIPARRAELYETILRRLLEGSWKELSLREYDEGRLEEKIRLLMHIAWHFASSKQHWRDLLPGSELSSVIELAPGVERLAQNIARSSTLLWELNERDGILVKAGEPALGMARSQVPYLFLHRTFHEYLVASYLSTLDAA